VTGSATYGQKRFKSLYLGRYQSAVITLQIVVEPVTGDEGALECGDAAR
jgi:hypothetical protein